jgi:hypothetical protein
MDITDSALELQQATFGNAGRLVKVAGDAARTVVTIESRTDKTTTFLSDSNNETVVISGPGKRKHPSGKLPHACWPQGQG